MKATKIYFKKLFNTGNYQHEEVGIEIVIEEGEKAKEVMQKAQEFVEAFNPKNADRIKRLEKILELKEAHSYGAVKEAEKELKRLKDILNEDLPF